MKKILTYLIITTLFIASCNGQNDKKIIQLKKNIKMYSLKIAPYNLSQGGDGLKFNYDTLSVAYIALADKSLKDKKFKFPNDKTFESKIKEVFEFDISKYKNKIVVLNPSMFPNIALKDNNFILLEDAEYDDSEKINSDLLFYYNNYLFNNDKISYDYLKLNQPVLLKDLVSLFGYNKDKDLVKLTFENFDFNNENLLHDLIFSYNIDYKKYYLRKGILDDIENIMFGGPTEDFSYAKEGDAYNRVGNVISKINENKNKYFQPEETIPYLYEKQLRVGVVGNIEDTLNKNSGYKKFLEKKNYYGLERLKDYVELIYQRTDDLARDQANFTIFDADGFTNLRKDKLATSEVLQRIKSGENINVLDNSGDRFLVKTKEGKEGYIHKSRI